MVILTSLDDGSEVPSPKTRLQEKKIKDNCAEKTGGGL